MRDGSARILTGEPYLDVVVAARGYRPSAVSGVRTDITVTLERYPEVLARIAGGVPSLPARHALRVSIAKKGVPRERRNISSDGMGGGAFAWLQPRTALQEIDETGEVALQVDGDGAYSVTISVRNEVSRGSSSIEGIEPAEIQVRESTDRQVFEIRIPEEALRQAVEQAATRRRR